MVRMLTRRFFYYVISSFACCGIVACTVATPNISALTELSSFSGKSTSPFDQDNVGGLIFFNGQCLPTVTSFELRLNHLPLWSPIPATQPSPGTNEYLVGTPPYDVDCSDGEFSFYVYVSQAMSNFVLNSTSGGPGDPSEIELRGVDGSGNAIAPTIVYTRPRPDAFQIDSNNYYSQSGAIEVGQHVVLKVKLIDEFGNHAMASSGNTIAMTVTPVDLDNTISPAGSIKDSTCTTPASAADTQYTAGVDELSVCYDSTGATAGHTIQIEVSAPGMLSNFIQIPVKQVYSAVAYMSAGASNGGLPPILLRGVKYNFKMGLYPLTNSAGRSVTSYSGNLKVDAYNFFVNLERFPGDSECPLSALASLECTTSATYKYFSMTVSPSYPMNTLSVGVIATPTGSCGPSCQIFASPSTFNITDYVTSTYYFGVMDGTSTYSAPYARLRNNRMKVSECDSLDLAEANSDGVIIPAIAKTYSVSTVQGDVEFFTSNDCSTSLGFSTTVTFAVDDIMKQVYYRISEVPSGGISTWNFNDGSQNTTFPFYVKPSDQ